MFLNRLWNDPSRRVWLFAAIAALILHGAVAAIAVTSLTDSADDEELGAAGIEVGLEFLAPRGEVTDLPPGPDTEASAASPPHPCFSDYENIRDAGYSPLRVFAEVIPWNVVPSPRPFAEIEF